MRDKIVSAFIWLITALILVTVLLSKYDGLRLKVYSLFRSKPYVELDDRSLNLTISEFKWGYGTASINSFSGDFEKLDEKVFDALEGKQGSCRVYMLNSTTDSYGKVKITNDYIGDIDLSELSKYENWHYWHRNKGISAMLYKKYISN
ncbi:hypothetical protein [Hufsiella ginkgonis]|uniref:Uncharacterized protein n=1 Tax=Hufsiella ginkgonis TaxID=2695274 RepID=A0A7K1Y3N5_9SPHI|nr:hypothetical protein [Hufsiella ginkgonis]MXV17728.1 hypothetical protein [Hufsiella ginkgonis]